MKIKYNKEKVLAILKEASEKLALEIFALAQRNLVERKWKIMTKRGMITTSISDTGFLLKSGEVYPIQEGWVIFYDCPYADKVEFGSPAGTKAELDDIARWCRRKLGIKKGEYEIASKIVKKIYEEGIEPRPFLRNAIEGGKKKWKILSIK